MSVFFSQIHQILIFLKTLNVFSVLILVLISIASVIVILSASFCNLFVMKLFVPFLLILIPSLAWVYLLSFLLTLTLALALHSFPKTF